MTERPTCWLTPFADSEAHCINRRGHKTPHKDMDGEEWAVTTGDIMTWINQDVDDILKAAPLLQKLMDICKALDKGLTAVWRKIVHAWHITFGQHLYRIHHQRANFADTSDDLGDGTVQAWLTWLAECHCGSIITVHDTFRAVKVHPGEFRQDG